MGWMTWVQLPAGTTDFSLFHTVETGSVFHLASYPVGTAGFSLGVMRSGREADFLPPCSAEVKNSGAMPLLQNNSLWYGD
jgi:hypothetical protein